MLFAAATDGVSGCVLQLHDHLLSLLLMLALEKTMDLFQMGLHVKGVEGCPCPLRLSFGSTNSSIPSTG